MLTTKNEVTAGAQVSSNHDIIDPPVQLEAPFKTSCYEDILSLDLNRHDLEEKLRRDVELVDVPHEAETFWLPANANPSTSLEKIAKSIFNFHSSSNLPINREQQGSTQYTPDITLQSALSVAGEKASTTTKPPGKKRPRCRGNGAKSGAEWWIQIREEGRHSNLGMPFHWDKDERLLEQQGEVVCPAISTVTYLTEEGAPTVVLESRATARGEVTEGSIDRAFMSYPALFKHFAFDGSFLHGVPEILRRKGDGDGSSGRPPNEQPACQKKMSVELGQAPSPFLRDGRNAAQDDKTEVGPSNKRQRKRRMRVTLLVNIWLAHKPSGIAPLPKSIALTLSKGLDIASICFDRKATFSPVRVEEETVLRRGGVGAQGVDAEGVAEASTVVVEAPLGPTVLLELRAPTVARLLTGDLRGLHSLLLIYGGKSCSRIISFNNDKLHNMQGHSVSHNRDLERS